VALYLDGDDVEVEIEAGLEEVLDDPMDGLRGDGDSEMVDGFMTPADLATVDDLDEESLDRVERWLAHKTRGRG
jgi:hypothetical protein